MTAGYDPLSPEPGRGVSPGRSASAEPGGEYGPYPGSPGPGHGEPRPSGPGYGESRPPGPGSAVPYPSPVSGPANGYTQPFGAPYGASAPPYDPGPARPPGARRSLGWPGIVALVLALALAVVAVLQARQISQLDDDLAAANQRVTEGQAAADKRTEALEKRAEQLEAAAGKAFNPEAVAAAVVPSVFQVQAGQFTGTAFAVGKPTAGGGTNLFTNYHVVQQVFDGGGREVTLKRRGESYDAEIVRVDKDNDVAHLTTRNKFKGLVTAVEPVKSGQQIVVVGAPLGLTDTVTTGVVSAFRKEPGAGSVIQFSAPINPGNSGGPVINADKQVVGIATAKARDAEGIGLAVPIKTACDQFDIC